MINKKLSILFSLDNKVIATLDLPNDIKKNVPSAKPLSEFYVQNVTDNENEDDNRSFEEAHEKDIGI
jgi:hypothetical protein